jgi:hypothetical protein
MRGRARRRCYAARIERNLAILLPESRAMLSGMDRLSTSLLALFASGSALAADTVSKPEWEKHFAAKGVRGTFVI